MFVYDAEHDLKDGEPWSEMDIDDLRFWLRKGGPVEDAASYLYRAGSIEDVEMKALELGLAYKRVIYRAGRSRSFSRP